MATQFNVLTWNTLQTGFKDYYKQNDIHFGYVNNFNFFNYTANIIESSGANIVALQEIYNNPGEQVLFTLCQALRQINGSQWFYIPPITAGLPSNTECYGFLWRDGCGFQPEIDATKPVPAAGSFSTTNAVCGLASNKFPNNAGKPVEYNYRRAAYLSLIDENNTKVIITNYHAPDGINGPIAGLSAVADMPELKNGAAFYPIILCGDYNVNIIDDEVDYQEDLLTPTGSTASIHANTSLTTKTPTLAQNQPTDPLAYRVNAYDNIISNHTITNAIVVDLISNNITAEDYKNIANSYILSVNGQKTFPNSNTITTPITTTYNSFILTRYAISDHLPVFATVTV